MSFTQQLKKQIEDRNSIELENPNPNAMIFYGKSGTGKTPSLIAKENPDESYQETLQMVVSKWGWDVFHIDIEKSGGARFLKANTYHTPTIEQFETFMEEYNKDIVNNLLAHAIENRLLHKVIDPNKQSDDTLVTKMITYETLFSTIKNNDIDLFKVLYTQINTIKQNLTTKEQEKIYPFMVGVLDSFGILEEWCSIWAAKEYKKSVIGKKFEGTDLLKECDNQTKWMWFWNTAIDILFNKLSNMFPHLIIVAHTKDKLINMEETEVVIKNIDIQGKLATKIFRECDAVAYVYPKKGKIMVNFTRPEEIADAKGRCPHLWDLKEELDWNNIFLRPNYRDEQ